MRVRDQINKTITKNLCIIIVFLIASAVIVLIMQAIKYVRISLELKKSGKAFYELIESEDYDDLSLTIYYEDYGTGMTDLHWWGWSVDYFIQQYEQGYPLAHKIDVSSERLREHSDLLMRLKDVKLKPILRKNVLDTSIRYLFETKKDGKIFEVAMWGRISEKETPYLYINGIAVQEDDVFYDILTPFLPKDYIIK